MRPNAKGKRRIDDEDDITEEEELQESGPIEYSEAQKLLNELAASLPDQERLRQLRFKVFAAAGKAWEDRERINADLRKARAHLSRSEARWMAEEGIEEKMTFRQQRKMERKTRDERRNIEDIEDEYVECNIRYTQWARLCDLFRMEIDADTAALGKLK